MSSSSSSSTSGLKAVYSTTMASSMLLLIKTFIVIFLIFTSSDSGGAHGLSLKEGLKEEPNPRAQRIVKAKVMRKLLGIEATLMDYNEPSANPSHEPRKGSPGGRASFNP